MNRAWHETHRLPKSATLIERMNWHIAHAKHCACRPMPKTVAAALESGKFKTCSRGHKYQGSGTCPVCWHGSRRHQSVKSPKRG